MRAVETGKMKTQKMAARDDNDPIEIALRQMHAGITAEAVPSEFLNILADIDRKLDNQKAMK